MSENTFRLLRDARAALKQGAEAIAERQRARLADIVAYARDHSPYYRELYKDLPDRVEDATLMPVTDKKKLMAHFDEWVTDPDVTIDKVRTFISEPERIGESFLKKYTALTTSGTTGTPGLFLWDDRNMAVTYALLWRALGDWIKVPDVAKIVRKGGRLTLVCATGGHYAEAVAGARLRKQRGTRAVQVLPAGAPIGEIVAHLNRFQPAVLAPYASIGALLASEQAAGRLQIHPALVVLSAEALPNAELKRIGEVFGVRVHYSYAATECPFISYSCDEGWLHVNTDWIVFERVDSDHRPIEPGKRSHTVLVSNLANQVQPILRYDLGDRILQRLDPCPCGNAFPAIRVEGRTADVLTFETVNREQVSIPALMFEVVETQAVELFQIVQTTHTSLRVRLRIAAGAAPDQVWHAVRSEIHRVLSMRGLEHVRIERAEEPPQQSEGGKYRAIVPLVSGGV